MISLDKDDPAYQKLQGIFEKEWTHRSVQLTQPRIDRYKKRRKSVVKVKSFTDEQLETILGTAIIRDVGEEPKGPPQVPQYWRDCTTGFVRKKTAQLISETTDWDEKGYSWYGTGKKHPYNIGDKILIFDFTARWLRLAEVKAITYVPIHTKDGQYFVAFKALRRKRFTRELWSNLHGFRITNSNACNSGFVKLKPARAEAVINAVWRA
jgi:hypothetical protein